MEQTVLKFILLVPEHASGNNTIATAKSTSRNNKEPVYNCKGDCVNEFVAQTLSILMLVALIRKFVLPDNHDHVNLKNRTSLSLFIAFIVKAVAVIFLIC